MYTLNNNYSILASTTFANRYYELYNDCQYKGNSKGAHAAMQQYYRAYHFHCGEEAIFLPTYLDTRPVSVLGFDKQMIAYVFIIEGKVYEILSPSARAACKIAYALQRFSPEDRDMIIDDMKCGYRKDPKRIVLLGGSFMTYAANLNKSY